MKTKKVYEKSKTVELQSLLKKFERASENNEILMDIAKYKNENFEELKRVNDDYEIDINLIRRELNRRLWFDK